MNNNFSNSWSVWNVNKKLAGKKKRKKKNNNWYWSQLGPWQFWHTFIIELDVNQDILKYVGVLANFSSSEIMWYTNQATEKNIVLFLYPWKIVNEPSFWSKVVKFPYSSLDMRNNKQNFTNKEVQNLDCFFNDFLDSWTK